jgi:hypothetical protein
LDVDDRFFGHYELLTILAEACEVLPQGWVAAGQASAAGRLPAHSAYAQLAMRRVGWQRGCLQVTGAHLTVRMATALQMDHGRWRQRHADFAAVAAQLIQHPSPRDAEAAGSMAKLLPKMWSVRCRNNTKEVFWRLTTNALPTADRMAAAAACICNTANPPPCTWALIFCPMAQWVVAAVKSELLAWSQQQQQQQQPAAAASSSSSGLFDVFGGWSASVWCMPVILRALSHLSASRAPASSPLAIWALTGGRWRCFVSFLSAEHVLGAVAATCGRGAFCQVLRSVRLLGCCPVGGLWLVSCCGGGLCVF